MANFAVLSGTTVTNVIVAKTKKAAELATNSECIEYSDLNPAGIGWNYVDGVWINPEPIIDEA